MNGNGLITMKFIEKLSKYYIIYAEPKLNNKYDFILADSYRSIS